MSIEYLRIFAYTQCAKLLEWQWFWCLCLPESVEGARGGALVFTGRTIVVTKPVSRDCTKLIQIGHWKRQPGEWVSFDLTVSSIANEGAFTEPFGTFATVMVSATSGLKLGCLRSTWTTWEEKEAQDCLEHLAVNEPYQCSEAHTASAEVEDSDVLQVCQCLLCRLFASVSCSRRNFDILRLSVSVWPWKFNSPTSFPSLKVKADTVEAAVADTEAADCEQCLQKETQRQESESRLQMLSLSGGEVVQR